MKRFLLRPVGDFSAASFLRRLAAILYDSLLCIALAMMVTLFYQQVILRAWYGAKKLQELSHAGALDVDPTLASLVFLSLFGFFAFFWTRTGQTLGMQAWRIRVQNHDGSALSLAQALIRFITALASWACAGLGFFWMLWDKQHKTWHDHNSQSIVVHLPKHL